MKSRIFASMLVIFGMAFYHPVQAEFTCTGIACSSLPSGSIDALNSSLTKFETDYTNQVMKSTLQAAFLNNINSAGVGSGSVDTIWIGLGASAGAVQKDDIQIQQGSIQYPKLPNVGASLSPNFYLDLRPAKLLSLSPDSHLQRFTIHLHGMRAGFTSKDIQAIDSREDLSLKGSVKGYGGSIRYQLVTEANWMYGLLSWKGLNVGGGFSTLDQDYTVLYKEKSAPTFEIQGLRGKWASDTQFDYRTKVQSTFADIRTGVGAFWFFTIFVGAGGSYNRGTNDLSLTRTGPYTIQPNIQEANIPREFQALLGDTAKTSTDVGVLGLNTSGSARLNERYLYGLGGFEINLYYLKAVVEATAFNREMAAASFALKIGF